MKMIKELINFKETPVKSGVLSGIGFAISFILAIAGLFGILFILSVIPGDAGTAGAFVGFLICPLFIFAGAPWSFFVIDYLGPHPILFITVVSGFILLNG